jgi:Domain of unknown function (DUF4160)
MEKALEKWLEKYVNYSMVDVALGVYFIKELVGKIRNMKIEIYPNDHNPPHFHIRSNDQSINATFRLDTGELIDGVIGGKDQKRIEAFFTDSKTQALMRHMWNKSKDENQKVS